MRYVFDYIDGFRFTGDGSSADFQPVRLVHIYTMAPGSGSLMNEWPRKRDEYVQLSAESDEALNDQIAIWRKVGCPATPDEMREAVERWNAAQTEVAP